MSASEALLRQLQKRHEIGRARWALLRALPAALFGPLALAQGAAPREALLAAALLVATTWMAGFRSRPGLFGAWAGALLGAAPLAVGLAAPPSWHLMVGGLGACVGVCALLCAAAGAACGVWLSARLVRLPFGRLDGALAFATTGGLTALLGCQVVGVGSLLGALVGLALGALAGGVAVRRHA